MTDDPPLLDPRPVAGERPAAGFEGLDDRAHGRRELDNG